MSAERFKLLQTPGTFAQKSISKVRRELERLETWVEFRSSHDSPYPSFTFNERKIIADYQLAIQTGRELVFYDIGANIGQHAIALSRLPQIESVLAFEPVPLVFESLSKNVARAPKIRCFNIALGDRDGIEELNLNDFSPASSFLPMLESHTEQFPYARNTTSIQVNIRKLDSFVYELALPRPDIIKIDVQGFEERVIEGGASTVAAAHWLAVELTLVPLYEGAPLFDSVYRHISKWVFDCVN